MTKFNFFGLRKRPKYGNKKVVINGITFDSKKEGERWLFLKAAEERGDIQNLKRQVKYELLPAIKEEYDEQLKTKTVKRYRTTQLAVKYTADFTYNKGGELVVEDVKSSPAMTKNDKAFQLRKKLLYYFYHIKIREIFKANETI